MAVVQRQTCMHSCTHQSLQPVLQQGCRVRPALRCLARYQYQPAPVFSGLSVALLKLGKRMEKPTFPGHPLAQLVFQKGLQALNEVNMK